MKSILFFKGLSWLLLLNLLIKPVWIFAIDRKVQNLVGHEQYGTYFAILNLSIVFSFIADAGLANMLTQRIAGKTMLGTRQFLLVKLMLLLLYIVVCCLAGWISGITEWRLFLYIILVQSLASLFLFFRSLLAANQLFKTDAFFSVADKALMIFLCSGFIYGWWQPISLQLFLQLQVVSISIALSALLAYSLHRQLIEPGKKEKLSQIVKWIMPFATIILLMSMHYRLDGFLLERIRPDGAMQAGIYAAAFRLLDAANMIGYLTASFLVPFIARNKDNDKLLKDVLINSQHLLVAIAIFISCFALSFAPWIQALLYHTGSPLTSEVIQLCLAVLPAYYLIHIYGSALTATSNFRLFTAILVMAVIINIVLNFLLIPSLGAKGCCIAALVSQYSCAIGCYLAATKKLKLQRSLQPWLTYPVSAGIFLLILFLLKMAIHSVWVILAVIALLALLLAITQQKMLKPFFRSLIQQTNA